MEEMMLPVTHKGKEMEFPVRMVILGYTHQFAVLIDGLEVIFEKDDQGEFRAWMNVPHMESKKLPDAGLLQAISEVLTSLQAVK